MDLTGAPKNKYDSRHRPTSTYIGDRALLPGIFFIVYIVNCETKKKMEWEEAKCIRHATVLRKLFLPGNLFC